MIEVKTAALRKALMDTYDFDCKHAECIDSSTGQFTGNFWHETYKFNDKTRVYYFQGSKLCAYEDKE